jgi:hypothetical protein
MCITSTSLMLRALPSTSPDIREASTTATVWNAMSVQAEWDVALASNRIEATAQLHCIWRDSEANAAKQRHSIIFQVRMSQSGYHLALVDPLNSYKNRHNSIKRVTQSAHPKKSRDSQFSDALKTILDAERQGAIFPFRITAVRPTPESHPVPRYDSQGGYIEYALASTPFNG